MSDYISRQDAIKAVESSLYYDHICGGREIEERYDGKKAIEKIKRLPSADVRENVKGSLIEPYIEEYYGEWYHCSVCGSNMQGGNFCNECGADLRGGSNG